MRERYRIRVQGIVQGVGFRPFVYGLARRCDLSGSVHNDASGVLIEAEGEPETLNRFLSALRDEPPPLAVVERVAWERIATVGGKDMGGFHIEASPTDDAAHRTLIAPDVALCADCLRELFDPADRRFRYPFINCTNCGPRFTIVEDVPYDRERTTMARFPMCPACRREYEDPADRRFHAQPNACPVCGPRVRLTDRYGGEIPADDPIRRAADLLRQGAVLAVKGLGGYHLACDPFSAAAVAALRGRKARQDKPFALMAGSREQIRALCRVSPEEEALLLSPARPIVLLERCRPGADGIAGTVAPRQRTLGVMLAYTPLHHLLLGDAGRPLVMTSGNRSDEPIAFRDDDARESLGEIADAFLVHNRPIHMRCDDSVARVVAGAAFPLRRSRGYAPMPLTLAEPVRTPVLACGGALKNTFCLARDRHAFLSHHIGDLESYETLRSFREGIEHFCRLFDVRPERIVCDLHPEYLSTKYAREREAAGLAGVAAVQHHHAHVAACLADCERPAAERVIGVALDGTGYGTDGAIWGGEFLAGSIAAGFTRRAHLEYLPLPGGEAAIRQPWRMAMGALLALYGEEATLALPLDLVRRAGEIRVRQIARLREHRLNTPWTSSAGRLFDVVAALAGVPGSDRVTYEGQAAVELELAAAGVSATPGAAYPFHLRPADNGAPSSWVVETSPLLHAVTEDIRTARRTVPEIAARFHWTMAEIVGAVCERIREEDGVSTVALSGGTFQNALLLEQVLKRLEGSGFTVYRHRRVPPGDGGLCLGQAALADHQRGNEA